MTRRKQSRSDLAMNRVAAIDARALAARYGIPLDCDFHALPSATVESIIAAANSVKYRQPRNANGSRARYFHARLVRAANRKESRVMSCDLELIASAFGGGWVVPHSPKGKDAARETFDCDTAPLPPLGGDAGWIVEPYEASDFLQEWLAQGLIVRVPRGELRS